MTLEQFKRTAELMLWAIVVTNIIVAGICIRSLFRGEWTLAVMAGLALVGAKISYSALSRLISDIRIDKQSDLKPKGKQ